MTLDEIFSDIVKDFKIDQLDLGGEAVRSSDIFCKYIKLYSESKLKVELLQNQQKHILASRRKYYSGDATPEEYQKSPFGLKIKNETTMKQYLENDAEVIKSNEKILIEQQKTEIFYGCLDELKRRGYAIKTAVDMRKFEAGI